MAFRMRWPWQHGATGERGSTAGEGFTWLGPGHAGEPRWAHASGWMLLSRPRRKLSCVVPSGGNVRALLGAMPTLCDCLTEAGFPWEMLVVDASGTGCVATAAAHLAQAVPLRIATSDRPASRAHAMLAGISQARGDGILLADPTMDAWLDTVPLLIESWVEGRLATSCADLLGRSYSRPARDLVDTRDFDETDGGLVLLDRSVLDGLV